jgi:hypothetical protein
MCWALAGAARLSARFPGGFFLACMAAIALAGPISLLLGAGEGRPAEHAAAPSVDSIVDGILAQRH